MARPLLTGGVNSVFEEHILAEKLSKLDTTQQCIETLSHWCIFHQSKAEIVVATWDKQFHSSQMVKKIPLLYLANDILQNSKRKGSEFVSEFWQVLPGALQDIIAKGDDHGKNVVSRLVEIWEERKVFGSHARGLRDLMLGEQLPPPLEFSRKRSRSVKYLKRDSRSIRTKLTIGGPAEKIVSAFHLVSEHRSEDEEISKCKSAIQRVRKMEEEVDLACTKAKDPKRNFLSKELEGEENVLKESIEKLKVVEANRTALISQIKEALHEQESELENVRTQMQVAQAQAEEASDMRKRLDDDSYFAVPIQPNTRPPTIATTPNSGHPPKKSAAAIAAEVADRLAASTSSEYIMTSVLSTFAAEEAKNAGLTRSSSLSSSSPTAPVNSLSTLPPPPTPTAPLSNTYQSILVPQMTLQQSQTPTSTQTQYNTFSTPSPQQYLQQSGVMANSYSYMIPPLPPGPPPPPPPPQPYMITQQQPPQQHEVPLPQQPPAPPSFRPLGLVQPPGMVYYGHPHHSN